MRPNTFRNSLLATALILGISTAATAQIVLDLDPLPGDQGIREAEGNTGGAEAVELVATRGPRGVSGFQVDVRFDETQVRFKGFEPAGLMAGGVTIAWRMPGGVRIIAGLLDGSTITPLGTLGQLSFERIGDDAHTPVRIELVKGSYGGRRGLWNFPLSEGVTFHSADGDAEAPSEQDAVELEQNHPNPFNPSTVIRYALAEPADVRLTVYSTLGQEVRTLVNSAQAAGAYSVQWDGRDAFGRGVATGTYIYRLQAGPNVAMRKMIFAK